MSANGSQLFPASPLIWTNERVFVSPSFGCPARCVFCYLPEADADKQRDSGVAPDALADQLRSDSRFKAGVTGTVLSLGCLSEALAPHSITATLRFLAAMRGVSNPIQIATRWVPPDTHLRQLLHVLQDFRSVLFHSMVEWNEKTFEIGTPAHHERERFIATLASAGICSTLFVKPFIIGHTPRFTASFIDLAGRYGIKHAVVGRLFVPTRTSHIRQILESVSETSAFLQTEFPIGPNVKVQQRASEAEAPPAVLQMTTAFNQAGITVRNHSLDTIKDIYG